MGRAHLREEARRGGDHKGEGDIARIQLEGAGAQLQQNIARSRYQVDVVDEDDNGSIVTSALINEATHRRPELLIARPGGSAQAGIRNPQVEANLEIESTGPIGRQLGLDGHHQAAQELVGCQRVGHRQYDGVAGVP